MPFVRPGSCLLSLASAGALLAGCVTNDSDARILFNHCRADQAFLDRYIAHEGPKALMAGLTHNLDGRRSFACNWSGGRDERTAQAFALEQCKTRYQNCYVYAIGNGETEWVREERQAIAREQQLSIDEFVDGFLDGVDAFTTTRP